MPLHYDSAEAAVSSATTSFSTTPETVTEFVAPVYNGPRYDAAAVKEILARAEAMQAYHRATLTPDAIIALGQEIGVEPEFVKRALAQAQATATAPIVQPSQRKRAKQKRYVLSGRALTRNQRAAALLPAAFYLLFMPFLLKNVDVSSNAAICFYVFLPAFLALCAGSASKRKTVGALGGALLGFASTFTLLIVTALNHRYLPNVQEFLMVLGILSGSGAALGVASAFLFRLVSRPRRKRLRVRFVVESEETLDMPKGEWA